jgi:hypothetical protein
VSDIRPNYYKTKVLATVPGSAEKVEVEVECFDLIDALGGGFYFGNALKYLFRAGRKTKDRAVDLRKTITYCGQVIERDERA